MSQIKITVDADNMLGRQFDELERKNLPFAIMQATNATAYGIRQQWQATSGRVFDRPTGLTQRAAQYRKATKSRNYADVFLRDEASGGTPPAKYLQAQVEGGTRRKKGFEILLQQKGVMPAGMFAVAGDGADLDQFGNVRARQISQVLSQLGARQDKYQNQTETSAKRRRGKRKRGGEIFALQSQRGKLRPGVYERIATGFGSAVRSLLIFTRGASYQPRYNIFGLAQRAWDKLMPFHFNRELAKAIQTSKFRGARMSQKRFLADFDAMAVGVFMAAGMADTALYWPPQPAGGPGTPCDILVDRGIQALGDDPMPVAAGNVIVRFQRAQVVPVRGGIVEVDGDQYRLAELLDDDGSMIRWAVARV